MQVNQVIQINSDDKKFSKFNGTWVIGNIQNRVHIYKLGAKGQLLNPESKGNYAHITKDNFKAYTHIGWISFESELNFESACAAYN